MDKRLLGVCIVLLSALVFVMVIGLSYKSDFLVFIEYVSYSGMILGCVVFFGELDDIKKKQMSGKRLQGSKADKERLGKSTPAQVKERLKRSTKDS